MPGKMNLARATALRQIAAIRGVAEKPVNDALVTIKSNMDTWAGLGDPLDKALTPRDLYNLGMISVQIDGRFVSGGSLGIYRFNAAAAAPTAPIPTTVPPAPTGLAAVGSFTLMHLTWNPPSYSGHSFTEIWRASVDNVGVATRIGTQPSTIGAYADGVPEGSTFYYWIRYVSTSNTAGPYNAIAGTVAQTAVNAAYLIAGIAAQITESELYAGLNSRLNNIETHTAQIGNINGQYTIKLDVNGKVSGIGLMNNGATSEFGILADKFWISTGADSYGIAKVPFSVVSGNVYIKSAFIQDASITNAKIGSLAADKITAGTITATIDITAPTINGGAINGTVITGGTLQTAASGDRFVVSQASGNAQFIGNRGDGVVQAVAAIGYNGGGVSILNLGLSASCSRPLMYAQNINTTMILGSWFNYGVGKTGLFLQTDVNAGLQAEAGLRSIITNPNAYQAAVRGESDSYGLGLEGTSSDLGAQLRLVPGGVSVPTHASPGGSVYMSSGKTMYVNKNGGTLWSKVPGTTVDAQGYGGPVAVNGWWIPAMGYVNFIPADGALWRFDIFVDGAWRIGGGASHSGGRSVWCDGVNMRFFSTNTDAVRYFYYQYSG